MALSNFVFAIAFIAVAQAAFNNWPGFQPIQVPDFDFEIPDLPQIPDIRRYVPKENEHFHGVSSQSFVESSDINGVKSHRGGADVHVNKEGNVDEDHVRFHGGDKDGSSKESSHKKPKPHEPKFRSFEPFKPMQFKPFEPLKFEPIKFEPIKFEPIKFEPIKFEPIKIKPIDKDELLNYVPKDNQQFVAFSQSSHLQSSNINGHETVVGGAETILNKNGKVDQDVVGFSAGDKPDKKQHEKLKKEKVHKQSDEKLLKKHKKHEEQIDDVVVSDE